MTTTYTPIATVTATGSAAVNFTSIPSTYTDLILIMNLQAPNSVDINVRVNSDTGTNYSRTVLSGTGGSGASLRNSNMTYFQPDYNGYVTNTMSQNTIIHFMNYSNTTTYKTMLARTNNWEVGLDETVGLWRSTSAINRLDIALIGASYFSSGSTFSLYGVASTNIGAKAYGGIVTQDSNYYYHTFYSSGTFTPLQSLTVEALVIAGGGGGGAAGGVTNAGGGGAGGLSYHSGKAVTATNYTVTIGAGGSGGATGYVQGADGSNSVFDTITSNGGGGGGAGYTTTQSVANGRTGGSGGGGGSLNTSSTGTGGSSNQGNTGGATGYGNAGGIGYHTAGTGVAGAGGGGAGAVGGNANNSTWRAGAGGNGLSTWSAWGLATGTGQNVNGTVYYAGGGSGASGDGTNVAGGYGGGATGGKSGDATQAPNATANTGGGGGGGPVYTGAGGSGIVIVRYAK